MSRRYKIQVHVVPNTKSVQSTVLLTSIGWWQEQRRGIRSWAGGDGRSFPCQLIERARSDAPECPRMPLNVRECL